MSQETLFYRFQRSSFRTHSDSIDTRLPRGNDSCWALYHEIRQNLEKMSCAVSLWVFFDRYLIAQYFFINIRMCLFRAFDTYVVKVLGGHPQGGRQKLKYHTTFCVQQEALGNTCDFLVSINIVAFGA